PREGKSATATGQIKLKQAGQKVRTRRIVEVWIGNAETEVLSQKRVRELHTEFCVVNSFDVRQIRAHAGVRQSPLLIEGDRLIDERILAGRVFNLIQPIEGTEGQKHVRAERMDVARRDVD